MISIILHYGQVNVIVSQLSISQSRNWAAIFPQICVISCIGSDDDPWWPIDFFSMSFCLWCLLQVNYPFVTTKFWVNRARAHPMVIPDIINQVTCGFPKQSRWESAATGSSWACDSTGSGAGTGAFGIALTFASGRLVSGGLVSGGFVLSSTFSSFGTGIEVFEAIPNVWPSWRSGDNYISLDIELTIDNWQGLSTVTVDDNWQWQNCEIATSAWHLNSLQ